MLWKCWENFGSQVGMGVEAGVGVRRCTKHQSMFFDGYMIISRKTFQALFDNAKEIPDVKRQTLKVCKYPYPTLYSAMYIFVESFAYLSI